MKFVTCGPIAYSLPLLIVAGMFAIAHADDLDQQYRRHVLPILNAHCVGCHGPQHEEGGLRLDQLSLDVVNDSAAGETWHDVLNVLGRGEMPPAEKPPVPPEQWETLHGWVSAKVKLAIEARQASDQRGVLRRLNRTEYQNTMTDLLGMDMNYVRDLPPDAISPDGFTNDGRYLQMSALHLGYYLDSARRAMDRVIVMGPPPKPVEHVFPESNLQQWLGKAVRSNRLGRSQDFLARIKDDYLEQGEFEVVVTFDAEIKPDIGYPLLEVSVGYRPDTQILMREFDLVEITSTEEQTLEFRGRLEEFPLPVRGQGKFPGLVIRIRNRYDDGSPLPKQEKGKGKKKVYPDEPHLPVLGIKQVTFRGPVFDKWPPRLHRRVLFDSPLRDQDEPAYVREVLDRFMSRAFRRPVTNEELDKMVDFYRSIRPDFPSFEETIRETLAMVLIQPEFLYLIEPADDQPRPINDWELASRLSYFLWSTMPDGQLMEKAAAGTLHHPETLTAEVDRLLSDPRGNRFVNQFTTQWLKLDVLDSIAVSSERFPDVDDELKEAMRGETQRLFADLLQRNESIINLLDADYVMVNERLARHYDIDDVYGREFRRVPVGTNRHRGGLLSHASVLLAGSTGRDSHPVRRAVWIRDRLLNDPPAPPPPDVPSLEEADPKFHELSIREQLEIHRDKQACANCHRSIDPWGIALENFDAVGLWREEVQRKRGKKADTIPVQAVDALPGEVQLSGVSGLKKHLLTNHTDDFARSLASRMLTYALARRLELSDQPSIDDLCEQFAGGGYRLRDLVVAVANSNLFRTK